MSCTPLKPLALIDRGMSLFEFIFLKRRWAKDQHTMKKYLQKYASDNTPLWLLIFPEGTVVCEETRQRSHSFGEKMGYVSCNGVFPQFCMFMHRCRPSSNGCLFQSPLECISVLKPYEVQTQNTS
jgi:hypothetical protein